MKLVEFAVEVIRAALQLNVDGRTADQSLIRFRTCCNHAHCLNGFDGWSDGGEEWNQGCTALTLRKKGETSPLADDILLRSWTSLTVLLIVIAIMGGWITFADRADWRLEKMSAHRAG